MLAPSNANLIFLLSLLALNNGAKILGVFPSPGYSQFILASALMKGLAERGHEVTVISPFSLKTSVPNYTEIVTEMELLDGENLFHLFEIGDFESVRQLLGGFGLGLTEAVLKDEDVQKLLHSNETFDLVIPEIFLNEAHMGFARHFKAPMVLFCSVGAMEWINILVANPAPYSHVSLTHSGYSDHMTFWQRLRNSAIGTYERLYKYWYIFPKQDELLKRYFPNPPHLEDILYNASLVLLNSHLAFVAPVAHVPSMVEIGGFHVAPKKLPEDLQKILDGATEGAVLFSMGSNLRSKDLPEETVDGVLKAFSKLKQTVLWKWEDRKLPSKPKNVYISKWLPQQDILAHPNMRAFITHGGILSTTEAIFNGVPMICIPIFGDQRMNTEQGKLYGYSVYLHLHDLSEEKLGWALNEILTNKSYREAAQKRSRILKDQPLPPLQNAIFWIEHVLRHNGAPHLRTAALSLSWYQYFLLDVIATVVTSLIVLLLVIRRVTCMISRRFLRKVKVE